MSGTDRYLKSKGTFDKARQECADFIASAAAMLEKLKAFDLVVIEDHHKVLGDGIRASAAMGSRNSIEAKDWPTIKQLDDVIQNYNKTKIELKGSWEALAHEDRVHLDSISPQSLLPTQRRSY